MRIGYRSRRRGAIDKIVTLKRAEIARMLAAPPLPPMRAPRGGVGPALSRPEGAPLRLIAQVQPTPGEAQDGAAGAGAEAVRWAQAGAAAIAVPTDAFFLNGSYKALAQCREALDAALGEARPPLLAVDFIVDPIQLDRAADAGADAAILIARLVSSRALEALVTEARRRGIEPVVEAADEEEVLAAVAVGARIVGVNARDLNTFRPELDRVLTVLRAVGGRAVGVDLTTSAAPEAIARVAAGPASAAVASEPPVEEEEEEEEVSPTHIEAMLKAAAGRWNG